MLPSIAVMESTMIIIYLFFYRFMAPVASWYHPRKELKFKCNVLVSSVEYIT